MPEFCTCGALLPPDARFCHKCGRPLREEPAVPAEETEFEPAPPPPMPVAAAGLGSPAPIDFRNGKAVRAGLFTASLIFFVSISLLPLIPASVVQMIILLGGGFLSVVFYRRWSGEALTLRAGARMGWITGIFAFVFILLFFTLVIVAVSSSTDLTSAWMEQIRQQGGKDPRMEQQLTELLQQPGSLALMMLVSVVVMFAMTTILPSLGGILAAKVLRRD